MPAYARVSGIPAEGVAATIEREKAFAGDGTVIRLVGRLDGGRVAGTAVAWLSHGLVTLYFVGTQPEQRRRGIGAAMTGAALNLARERGVRTAAPTSSPVGEPDRLGFVKSAVSGRGGQRDFSEPEWITGCGNH